MRLTTDGTDMTDVVEAACGLSLLPVFLVS